MEKPIAEMMDAALDRMRSRGTVGVRIFVANCLDYSAENIAYDFCMMELAWVGKPYYTKPYYKGLTI